MTTEQAPASTRIAVPVQRLEEANRFRSFADVLRAGPEHVERLKAQIKAYALENDTVILPETVEVEWQVVVSVKGVKVPEQIYDGCQNPAEGRQALEDFRARVESANPGYQSSILLDIYKGETDGKQAT